MNGQVIVRTNNRPPMVSIVTPTNGANFPHGPPTTLNVSVFDPDGDIITKVRYLGNGMILGEPTGPFALNAVLPPGPVTLLAIAFDAPGAMGTSAPVNVTVAHPPIQITGVQRTSSGGNPAVAFNVTGTVSGSKYVLEGTSVLGPNASCTPLKTNTASGNTVPYSESVNPATNLFWRVRFQP